MADTLKEKLKEYQFPKPTASCEITAEWHLYNNPKSHLRICIHEKNFIFAFTFEGKSSGSHPIVFNEDWRALKSVLSMLTENAPVECPAPAPGNTEADCEECSDSK